jgi:anti-sigma regulatory factor (Ser/Thr protein kinase)
MLPVYHYGKLPGLGVTTLDDLGLEHDVRRVEANSLAALRPVFDKLDDWMRVLGYPRKDRAAVILAAREAVTNAVRHGHRCDPGKRFRLRYLVRPAEVLVEVEDDGFGFDPECVADALVAWEEQQPRGRGLFLMRSYASWLSFNRAGNRVTLCRRRSDA